MIKSFKLETVSARVALIIAALCCLAASVVFAKWCLANAIAAQAPAKDVAELAVSLAPSDPQTHYALAVLNEKTFLPEDLSKSTAELEQSVALSPHDFRLWLALGQSRDRTGDSYGAEAALRRAVQLAPNYARVHWTLGNVLLRQGKTAEAFLEIRKAGENDATYKLPAITTASQIFGGNLAEIRRNIGDSANLNSALATFLVNQKRFDEAIQIWNDLPAAEKKTTLKTSGEELVGQLIAAKKYRDAMQIQSSLGEKPEAENFVVGKIFNGGFEADVPREKANAFDWQIADGSQPQIGFDDAQKASGNRSLVVIFNSSDGKDFRQISQTVAVEPRRKYVFSIVYKSELKTAATLRWEIADAADGKVLAATESVSNAAANWTNLKTEFTTSENAQAVVVRLVREDCKSIICPIAGKIWFDDLAIN
jgi:tetratricopeptide (TPR) repeat protein